MRRRVCRVTDITHDQWLEYRRTGICGSDAATVVGLNPYNSLYTLYNDKLGLIPAKEDNEAMRQGRDFEDYVARRWMETTGKKVRRNCYMWRSDDHPFMLADIDREVVGENAGLECKTTSAYSKADLEGGEVPLTYYVQCQHYMAVMGFDRMYLAVLVLGVGFYCFTIERDESEISALIEAETAFWRMIEAKTPPPVDGSDSTMATLAAIYPTETVAGRVQLTGKAAALIGDIEAMKAEQDSLKESINRAKAAIMQEIGDAEGGQCDGWRVSWKAQTRNSIDGAALKRDYPEIYKQYSKKTTSLVFRLAKIKEDKAS